MHALSLKCIHLGVELCVSPKQFVSVLFIAIPTHTSLVKYIEVRMCVCIVYVWMDYHM